MGKLEKIEREMKFTQIGSVVASTLLYKQLGKIKIVQKYYI
jgi:hypothetical protein